jgi:hypothetical protein
MTPDRCREQLEHAITERVAIAVVGLFEMIEIEDKDGDRSAIEIARLSFARDFSEILGDGAIETTTANLSRNSPLDHQASPVPAESRLALPPEAVRLAERTRSRANASR